MRSFTFNRNISPIISWEQGSILILTLFSSEEDYGKVKIIHTYWQFIICSMMCLLYLTFITSIQYMELRPFYRWGTEKLRYLTRVTRESVIFSWKSYFSNEPGQLWKWPRVHTLLWPQMVCPLSVPCPPFLVPLPKLRSLPLPSVL